MRMDMSKLVIAGFALLAATVINPMLNDPCHLMSASSTESYVSSPS